MSGAVYLARLLFGVFCVVTVGGHAAENASADGNNEITESRCSAVCKDLQTNRSDCCRLIYKRFKTEWFEGGHYLTDYMTKLKSCKCDEFNRECKTPIYDYTPFTRLVYDNFCNRSALFAKCIRKIQEISRKDLCAAALSKYGDDDVAQFSETTWENLTASMNPRKMKLDDLNEPCVQIALFDRPGGGVGRFHEVILPHTAFCEMTWVGYDIDTTEKRAVSPWTSWSIWCRISIGICMTVAACLACAIIIANFIVISVYLTTRKPQNNQSIFKLSIALGDLLSGLIVLPSITILQYLLLIRPQHMGDTIQSNATKESDLVRRQPADEQISTIPSHYVDFIGFFTMLSLSVSTYSLLAASCDRFWAIFSPLRYNEAKAKRFAKIACAAVWTFAVIIASAPFMDRDLEYRVILSIMVASRGTKSLFMLAVILGIPLIALCGINCGTFQSAKRSARLHRRLTRFSRTAAKEGNLEKRLSKVLGMMVGVFSLCVFPLFFLIAIGSIFENTYYNNPDKLNPNAAVIYNSVEYCAIYLFLSNNLWNCLIYSYRSDEFQKAVKSLSAVKMSVAVASTISNAMRRLCDVRAMYTRKKSTASSVATTTNSNPTPARFTSTDSICTPGASNELNIRTYRNGRCDAPKASKLCSSTEVKKTKSLKASKSEEGMEHSAEDSSFRSFEINAGTDRLLLSVIENLKEDTSNRENEI